MLKNLRFELLVPLIFWSILILQVAYITVKTEDKIWFLTRTAHSLTVVVVS
jgi:hypothetical protein